MRHTACSSHRQMKALFFILLLAGHDAVRVTQEVGWSKSKWNELHADCSWSWEKGCSEGCVRKRLPLDPLTPGASCRHNNSYLLENDGLGNYHKMLKILIEKSEKYGKKCHGASRLNLKCRRREVQMGEAFQFIMRAFTNETFTATLDESEKATLSDGFQKVLKNLAKSQEEAESTAELSKKMKCQMSEFLQDPKKALAKGTGLGRALFSDNQTAKQQAKLQLAAMPESCSPVSAEEKAEGLVKLKDLKKGSEQEPGEASLADELDAALDEVVEEAEMESASSALQVTSGLADPPPIDVYMAGAGALAGAIHLAITTWWPLFCGLAAGGLWGPVVVVIAAAVSLGILAWAYFAVCEVVQQLSRLDEQEACFLTYVFLPFRLMKGLAKGAAIAGKGAAKLGKGIYKYFKGKPSNTSVLLETDVMDEPLLQAEPLAIDEVSVS